MWRYINRLDYGKKYCLNSITVQENDLHAAIVRALKRFNAENESTYLTLMKATIGDAIGINGGSDEIDLLTRRVETLNKRMITLVNETIQSGGDMESNEDEFKDISEQIEQLNRRIAAIQDSLANAANNYDGQAFAPKAQYYRHADGRDDGLKKIDPDSAEAFADWLENREKGGHPWEVCRGGNSTHVSLYVGLGRVAEGCYHLALAAKSYGRCVEAIKFYLALKHAGLPVIIYGAEFIKKRLLGLERVGIVPNEVMPFYCHSRFPGEDVDSFRHLNHENPDAEIALIEWQPIKPVKLKENAHE